MRTLLCLLLFAVPALAQTKGPAEVTVAPGRLAAVPLTTDADAAEYVVLGDLDAFREYDPDPKQIRLRVIGYTPGVSYVVLSSAKGGKLQPVFVVKVVVTGVAPVPPGPTPPGPTPPPPVSPLVAAIKEAAATDGIGAAGLSNLAAAFTAAADLTATRLTAGDLQDMLGTQVRAKVATKPAATWAVIQGKLAALEAVAPAATPTKILTDADRATAAALFRALAAACTGGAK